MSKARELSQRAGVDGALSNRNAIINGSFKVAQRGTNVNVTGGRIYGLDRWCSVGVNNAEVMSMQQVENTAYDLDFTHYMKHTKSTTDGCWIYQRLEDVKRFSNKTLTLSYYAWVDSGTSSVTSGSWGRFNGVDENVSGYGGNVITVTTTPTKFVHTFTFADLLSTPASASDFFELNWYRNTASNLNLANVQLEVGDTATPFEHRSYGQELALCQRYFCTSGGTQVVPQFTGYDDDFFVEGVGAVYTNDLAYSNRMDWPVPMRARPTVTIVSNSLCSAANQAVVYSRNGGWNTCDVTSPNAGTTGMMIDLRDNGGFVNRDSCMYFVGYYADAEL